jgi:aspartyl-tRNA synthetase
MFFAKRKSRCLVAGLRPRGSRGRREAVDRIAMLLEGEDSLPEVVRFPMNQHAEDLPMGAPSPATAKQLREFHICGFAGEMRPAGMTPR